MKTCSKIFLCLIFLVLIFCDESSAQNNSDDIIYTGQITDYLTTPIRMTVDEDNNLYVTEHNQNCVVKYDAAGNFIEKIYISFTPISVAVDRNNNVFIGDKNTGDIYKRNILGNISLFYTGCMFPSCMEFSPDNLLYIVDSHLQHVIALDQSANVVKTFGNGTLVYPTSMAYDSKNERILIGEHGGIEGSFNPICKVWIFDLQGNLTDNFGSHGNEDGEFYRIQGISIGKCNNIYVCDSYQGNISVFDENYNFITKFGEYGDETGELNVPLDIVFDFYERILISSMNNGAVEIFNITDTLPTSNITNSDALICPGETTDIHIKLTGTAPWNFTYTVDGTNPTVITTNDETYILTVSDPGIYEIVDLSDAMYTGTCFTGCAVISQFELIPSIEISTEDPTICRGESTVIKFDLIGTPPWTFTYLVNMMNSAEITTFETPYFIEANEGGIYEVTELSDANCTSINMPESLTIELFEETVPDFEYDITGLEVIFSNNSLYASSYLWDFGDGTFSNEIDPTHEYQSVGSYPVILTASNIDCGENSIGKTINLSYTSQEDIKFSDNIRIYPNPTDGLFFLEFNNTEKIDLIVEVISFTGKIIYSKHFQAKQITEEIDLRNIPKGIYTIRSKTNEFIETSKLILSH